MQKKRDKAFYEVLFSLFSTDYGRYGLYIVYLFIKKTGTMLGLYYFEVRATKTSTG